MKAFQLIRLALRVIGVFPIYMDDFDRYKYFELIRVIIMSAPAVATVFSIFAYFLENIKDVSKVTNAMYLMFGYAIALLNYWLLFAQNVKILKLLNEMETIINQSKKMCIHGVHGNKYVLTFYLVSF